jgi:outer membrane protein OmpA-like peptidoglycan-associated protein
MLGIFGILGLRRRRALGALLAMAAVIVPVGAQAQSVTLNQFQGSETPDDGLEVSRPVDLGHGRFAANVYLDYARNPLVYEATQGHSSTQREAIVRDQLDVRVGVAVGLFDRVILFASGSGNLLMSGQERPGYVAADGTRVGDFNLGARVRLLGTPRLGDSSYGALAVQVAATLPMARWIASDSQLTGDSTVTVTPELLAEVGGRSLRLTANLGTRLRANQTFNTLTVGHELTWGLGLGVPVVGKTLEVDVEVYGATALSHPLEYATTPVEAIAGLRYRAESGWTAAVGAGPGLARGYGSPDFRALATVGWSQPAPRPAVEPEPEPVVAIVEPEPEAAPLDTDGDGVIDSLDHCPTVPGPVENDGCPLAVVVAATPVAPAEIVILQRVEFDTDESGTLAPRTVATLEEVRVIINDNPQIMRVSIEGHADERGTDAYNQALSERRAAAVMSWLVGHGIAARRFGSVGRGESDPYAPGFTPEAQQTNRNVQFFVLDPVATHAAR